MTSTVYTPVSIHANTLHLNWTWIAPLALKLWTEILPNKYDNTDERGALCLLKTLLQVYIKIKNWYTFIRSNQHWCLKLRFFFLTYICLLCLFKRYGTKYHGLMISLIFLPVLYLNSIQRRRSDMTMIIYISVLNYKSLKFGQHWLSITLSYTKITTSR